MYWDMNIPTQYYEEEFIEFERNFQMDRSIDMTPNDEQGSELLLENYAKFELKMKKGIKTWKSHRQGKIKSRSPTEKSQMTNAPCRSQIPAVATNESESIPQVI